tara:strand:+ start:29622 stop:29837 length:216 start_codon:yes stop_codon:yes gene_type:complete
MYEKMWDLLFAALSELPHYMSYRPYMKRAHAAYMNNQPATSMTILCENAQEVHLLCPKAYKVMLKIPHNAF